MKYVASRSLRRKQMIIEFEGINYKIQQVASDNNLNKVCLYEEQFDGRFTYNSHIYQKTIDFSKAAKQFGLA
jgi:hypothetical protein